MFFRKQLLTATILASATFASVTLPNSARADSQTLLTDVFNMYSNGTDPQVLETQRRGGWSGGSLSTRVRVVRPQLVSFEAPHFRAGCNGMDLYGGSFSFINSTQLIASLRSIAGSAVSYAFGLAIEAVCPSCASVMQKLRDAMERMNGLMQDSCTAGQALVDRIGVKDFFEEHRVDDSKLLERVGAVDSWFDGAFGNRKEESSLEKDRSIGAVRPENAVWKAMSRSALTTWFGTWGDTELQEVLMSITGTVLKTETDAAGAVCQTQPPDPHPEYCVRELPGHLLTVNQFIDGGMGANLTLYHCPADVVNCLDVTTHSIPWEGVRARVRTMLFGPGPGWTGGIITKLRDPVAVFTPAEEAFMTGAPMNIWTLLSKASYDPGSLNAIGDRLEEVISVGIAQDLILEMVGAVSKAANLAKKSGDLDLHAQLMDKLSQVEKEVRESTKTRTDVKRLEQEIALNEVARLAAKGATDQMVRPVESTQRRSAVR